MKIEITLGEIKSIIYNITLQIKTYLNNDNKNDFNFNQNTTQKLTEISELTTFDQSIDI